MNLHNPPASVLDQGREDKHNYRGWGQTKPVIPASNTLPDAAAPAVADTQELAAAPPAPAKKKRGK